MIKEEEKKWIKIFVFKQMEHVTKREVLALEKKIGKRSVAMRRWVNRRQKLSGGAKNKKSLTKSGGMIYK